MISDLVRSLVVGFKGVGAFFMGATFALLATFAAVFFVAAFAAVFFVAFAAVFAFAFFLAMRNPLKISLKN